MIKKFLILTGFIGVLTFEDVSKSLYSSQIEDSEIMDDAVIVEMK